MATALLNAQRPTLARRPAAVRAAKPAAASLRKDAAPAAAVQAEKLSLGASLAAASATVSLSAAPAASAASELAQLADNRLFVLLGLGVPVIGWVLFNIGAPALRQVDNMVNKEAPKKAGAKRRSIAAALTAVTAGALLALPEAADAATELAQVADNRLFVLLGLGVPVIGWVLFNIGAPALRQVDTMVNKEAPKKTTKRR